VEILKYRPEYLDSVVRIWESATKIGHPFLSEEFISSEKKNISSVYIPNGNTWVAVIQNNVVGFTILHGNEVGALFVLPEFHGHGVGYALMNKAHEMHKELKVEVFKENAVGITFYSRYGFNLVREYFHKESGIVMLCLENTKDS
jgi:putative acetyltransferase